MSDIIRLLPDSVANQIAAGEVIQRPSSVIKELVENSVDAGATTITVVLKDSGRTLIQVIDNGKGMSDTDARMAFERHATSKIVEAEDLFRLRTMGFRGEALASIAAIAQLDVRTRLKGASLGTRLEINGSRVEHQAPESVAEGTNIMVKNLFYNVPARRKFLKKDAVELSHCIREFERLALVNPELELTMIHNDVTLHSLRPSSLLKRISDLFGKNLDKTLVPVETKTTIVEINGFIGLPEHSRRRGTLQYLFVNGRNMRHPYFHKAIMGCYEQLLPPNQQPNYFLDFKVDPSTIDVNIHPTKNEIKFENEQAIWQVLVAAIREALGRFNAVPSIDFNKEDEPDIPVFDGTGGEAPKIDYDSGYNPFRKETSAPRDWDKLYSDFTSRTGSMPTQSSGETPAREGTITRSVMQGDLGLDFEPQTPTVLQLKNRYILSPSKDGLLIIDQHRAHKRILYERFLKEMKKAGGGNASQRLMFPEVVNLTAAQANALKAIIGDVTTLGFDLSFLGGNDWSINAVPASLDETDGKRMLLSVIDDFNEGVPTDSGTQESRIALTLAEQSAVRAGQPLGPNELDRISSELFRLSTPSLTPDGQRIFTIISLDDISRFLG